MYKTVGALSSSVDVPKKFLLQWEVLNTQRRHYGYSDSGENRPVVQYATYFWNKPKCKAV